MTEESVVFRGQKGLAHQHGDVVIDHGHAPLLTNLRDELAIACINP
jgi:hypothetical protein